VFVYSNKTPNPGDSKIMQKPFVYIVGAGPGDPALLTLKAYRLLTEQADIVIYDRLISDEILAIIPPHTKRIFAGKSCKDHHMTQEEIHACMLEHASQNKIIVRLKGGDPFIFGRGGEEMLFLASHHIPFEIVPGVNAADGCATSLGIPLTHRGLATDVRFITGHQQKDSPITLDWQSLASPSTTLVIFMGLANLPLITTELLKHGLAPNTPAVAIENGTTPKARKRFSTLESLSTDVAAMNLKAPSLIIIGKVVALGLTEESN